MIKINTDEVKAENTAEDKKPTFGISAKELWDKEILEIPMLIEDIIPKVGLTMVGGPSDTGKSTFLRQLGTEIALNRDAFLGYKIDATHNKVVYVSSEDDENSIAFLIRKQSLATEAELEGLENLTYVFDTDKIIDRLDSYLADNPQDLVVVDAFSDVYVGDMNMASSVRPYLNLFSDLAKRHNCAVIFLHHTGKRTTDKPPHKDNFLGSQGIEAKMRLLIEIRKDVADSRLRHLCIVKGNYVPKEMKQASIVLNFGEDMNFRNTGESVPFEDLATRESDSTNWKKKAVELKQNECLTISDIYSKLEGEGCKYGRSTIGGWVKGIECGDTNNESQEPDDDIQDAEVVA